MIVTSTAKRYGNALFDLALKNGILDEIRQEFKAFLQVTAETREFRFILANPNVIQRKRLFEDIFKNKLSTLLFNFLNLVLKNYRHLLLAAIFQDYQQRLDAHFRRIRAVVITAIPLPDDQLTTLDQELTEMLQADVTVENQVDPAMLGGVVVYVNGKVYNASLAEQFKELRHYLMHNQK
ncbi:ATP synthase F1 subunit delta [candidate division KSB1 bacterium]|nr:ATP synthase F1 subunit delta [candidate division KSB1 bacterium]